MKEITGGEGASSTLGSIIPVPVVVSPRSHAGNSGDPELSAELSYITDPSPPDAWDYGMVDYTGRDRFENIQKHLDRMMVKGDDK